MSVKTTVETTVTEEVKISAKTEQNLMVKFRALAQVNEQIALLEAQKDIIKAEVGKMRETLGVDSFHLHGWTVTHVAGQQKYYDKKKALKDGVNLDNYVGYKPKKAYDKITAPGEKASHREDEE